MLNNNDASTLNDLAGLIPAMPLKDRIQELVNAGYKQSELAKAAGKSRAAVSHWLSRAGAPPPTPAPPTAPKASAYDSAQAICKILQTVASATTCDVQSGFFSASIIDATIATSPRDEQAACQLIATQTRAPGSAFAGAGWELRMFHPMGSSTRPIASCKL